MKKQILKIAFVSALSAIALLAGCDGLFGNKPCEHTGGAATCTEPAVCDLCGESYGEALGHSHATTWTYDETKHWNECACGDKANEADHNWIAGEITTQPTCTTVGQQNYACECGATKVEELPIQHEYATEWTVGETTHWKECECGAKTEEAAHEYTIKDADELEHWTECVCGVESEHIEHEFPEEPTIVTPATGCKGHSAANPIMVNAGKQSYTCACGYALVEDYWLPHVDTDGDFTCDYNNDNGDESIDDGLYDCTSRVLPPDQSKLTIAQLTTMRSWGTSNKYFMEGVVIAIHDANSGVFGVQDSTGVILVRMPGNADDVQYSQWTTKIVVGDTIQVYGKAKQNTMTSADYNSTVYPAMYDGKNVTGTNNGSIVTILNHTHNYSDATCTAPATCACLATQGEALPHPDTDSDGRCDTCTYPIGAQVVSRVVSGKTGTENFGVYNATAGTWTWDNEDMTIVISKVSGSFQTSTNSDYACVKAVNNVTITLKKEATIKRLVITAQSTSYADELQKMYEAIGATVTVVGKQVTIDIATPAQSITAQLTSDMGTQARFTAVEIYYS